MKRIVLIADAHLQQGTEPDDSYKLVKKICKSIRPDKIIIMGDMLDCEFLGSFTNAGQSEGKRLSEAFNILRQELAFFKKCSKEEVLFLEGNHEERLERFLDSNPILKGAISYESIFEELEVRYIPLKEQPYLYLSDLYLSHGVNTGVFYARKTAELLGKSCICGHAHRPQYFCTSYPDGRIIEGIGLGSLTESIEYYIKGKSLPGHSNSFGELLLDENTGHWQCNNITIKQGKCIISNKLYTL